MFRWSVDGFLRSGVLEQAQIRAVAALVLEAAARGGYAIVDPTLDWIDQDPSVVTVAIRSQSYEMCTAHWNGFTVEIDTDTLDVIAAIRHFFAGAEPIYTNIPAATWEGAEEFGYPLGV